MSVRELAQAAKTAGLRLCAPEADRGRVLVRMAQLLASPEARARILEANAHDLRDAHEAVAKGELSESLVKRLGLDATKLDGLVDGLRQLAAQADLVGRISVHRELDDGLVLRRVSCPLGVLGAIFEARPDAVPQIASLAVKSGNAVVLKGGREAKFSNRALVEVLKQSLADEGFSPDAIALLEDREQVDALLQERDLVDLIIARGSGAFVAHIMKTSPIPVLGHSEGICHLYLHRGAVPDMAARIAVDAKCSYPAACNSIETLLWDAEAGPALEASVRALETEGVELRGCAETRLRYPTMAEASEDDWHTEYGAKILSIRRVSGLDAALHHIARYGSRHTEAIVTSDDEAALRFLAEVDAGGVFHNASTRFADGYRFGLGAEVGVSTSKLHARGPVGVEGLLTYRWLLQGHGQVTTAYGPGKRSFTHRDLP